MGKDARFNPGEPSRSGDAGSPRVNKREAADQGLYGHISVPPKERTPGTFAPQQEKNKRGAEPVPRVGDGEIKKRSTIQENEMLRVQIKVLGDLVPLGLEFKDLSHETDLYRSQSATSPLVSHLIAVEQMIDEAFVALYQDPDEPKFQSLERLFEEFKRSLEEVKAENTQQHPLSTSSENRTDALAADKDSREQERTRSADPYSKEAIEEVMRTIKIRPGAGQIVTLLEKTNDTDEKPVSYEVMQFNEDDRTFTLKKIGGDTEKRIKPYQLKQFLARQEIHSRLKNQERQPDLKGSTNNQEQKATESPAPQQTEKKRFAKGDTVRLMDADTNIIDSWQIISFEQQEGKLVAILKNENETRSVEVSNLRHLVEKTKLFEQRVKKPEVPVYTPIRAFLQVIRDTDWNTKHVRNWKTTWVDSGKIDT